MSDAYTPGLTVTRKATVRKLRQLPLPGTVLAAVGQAVRSSDIIAQTNLPGKVALMNLSTALGVMPDEVATRLAKRPGDAIAKGECIARSSSFFGLFKTEVPASVTGTLESVSAITGMAMLREPPVPVQVSAYVDGTVVEVIPNAGVVIETQAALVQGIFGLAGEVTGTIAVVAKTPSQTIDAADLTAEHKGKVLIGGGRLTLAGYRKAMEVGAAAIVVGGFAYQDVKEILGYDVGVAITGTEALPTTLVVTEGFGDIAMATATFELLTSLVGQIASVNGATQIRAGVIRPEIVVPHREQGVGMAAAAALGLSIGVDVRCIRAPYFGRIGKISALPSALTTMPSETKVRVLEVDFGGEKAILPRANVEVIEQ